MVTKERLQELIEKEEVIWSVSPYNEAFEMWLTGDVKIRDDCALQFGSSYIETYMISDLYETQAEAEWVAKMHTQRPEFFEPPIYEEWLKKEIFEFYSKDHKNYAISVCLEFDFFESPAKDYIEITNVNDFNHHKLFCAEKTKNNYIKACEYARNLFIGKENENETDSDR